MSDKDGIQKANEKGQADGAKYAKDFFGDQISGTHYSPPSDKAEKASYDSGHKNGRTGGRK